MENVQFLPNFILAAVNMEMTKANESSVELQRLMEIGYLNSQTGLDVAKEVKAHLTKAYELLDKVDIFEAKASQLGIAVTIAQQDRIIKYIELSL